MNGPFFFPPNMGKPPQAAPPMAAPAGPGSGSGMTGGGQGGVGGKGGGQGGGGDWGSGAHQLAARTQALSPQVQLERAKANTEAMKATHTLLKHQTGMAMHKLKAGTRPASGGGTKAPGRSPGQAPGIENINREWPGAPNPYDWRFNRSGGYGPEMGGGWSGSPGMGWGGGGATGGGGGWTGSGGGGSDPFAAYDRGGKAPGGLSYATPDTSGIGTATPMDTAGFIPGIDPSTTATQAGNPYDRFAGWGEGNFASLAGSDTAGWTWNGAPAPQSGWQDAFGRTGTGAWGGGTFPGLAPSWTSNYPGDPQRSPFTSSTGFASGPGDY